MPTRSPAERLDAAVDLLLAGEPPLVDAELRPLVSAAALTANALHPMPAGARFEARLADRLAHEGPVRRAADVVADITRRGLSHPGRLLAAGAVSTAALGVTVTALAMWRSTRHHPSPASRLLGR
jgi:hypothetical protein